jgi:hypothetical protein
MKNPFQQEQAARAVTGKEFSASSAASCSNSAVRSAGSLPILLLATFIGLVIFMIFALDRPFRGDLGLRPDAYQLIFDQLMKGNP